MATPTNSIGGGVLAGFDTKLGFTVTNNTDQNIYLQTSQTAFEQISANSTSTPETAYQNYPVRNNDNVNALIYLTVHVSSADGSVNLVSGTMRGSVLVTVNFA